MYFGTTDMADSLQLLESDIFDAYSSLLFSFKTFFFYWPSFNLLLILKLFFIFASMYLFVTSDMI